MSKVQNRLSTREGAFAKYKRTVIGEGATGLLILYECINMVITPLPTALGTLLRRICYPLLLRKMGRQSRFEANCTLRNPRKIVIGNNVHIAAKASLDVKPDATGIHLADGVKIGQRTILNCAKGSITIGPGSHIGHFCRIGAFARTSIGKQCRIGDQVCIIGGGHSFEDTAVPIIDQPIVTRGDVTIGDYVTIGEGATIIDGVTIGDHAEIGAHSFVNKDVAANSVVAGVPATVQQEEEQP